MQFDRNVADVSRDQFSPSSEYHSSMQKMEMVPPKRLFLLSSYFVV
jgi:hypothetical protein